MRTQQSFSPSNLTFLLLELPTTVVCLTKVLFCKSVLICVYIYIWLQKVNEVLLWISVLHFPIVLIHPSFYLRSCKQMWINWFAICAVIYVGLKKRKQNLVEFSAHSSYLSNLTRWLMTTLLSWYFVCCGERHFS